MNFNIILSIIISLIIIVILHNLFIFFKNNLTVPKIKDFIEKPSKDYEDIYKIINSANNTTINTANNTTNNTTNNNNSINNNDTTSLENLPIKKVKFIENDSNYDANLINNKNNISDMKSELKKFLNNLES